MTSLLAYSLYAGIFLLAGYAAYRLILAAEKQPALNRAALIGLYAVSLCAILVPDIRPAASAAAPAGTVVADMPEFIGAAASAAPSRALRLCVVLYVVVAGGIAASTLLAFVRLWTVVLCGRRLRCGAYTIVLLSGKTVPFSMLRYIVMSEDDYARYGDMIVAHEIGHLSRHHWLDLLLAQVVCIIMWYNPAAWLMRAELRRVHEYQADGAAILSGVDTRAYQMLLIEKAAGVRLQSLANGLNHSNISKRITMMYKQNSRAARRMRVFALVPAMLVALAAANSPVVASALSTVRATAVAPAPQAATAGKVVAVKNTEKSASAQMAPSKLPEYPGGQQEMFKYLAYSVKYPAEAMNAGVQGRVLVNFTVKADGSIADVKVAQSVSPALDAEAVRVVSEMPRWNPATNESGEAVNCTFALPVQFKLTDTGKKKTEAKPARTFDDVVVVGYGTTKKEPDSAGKIASGAADAAAPAVYFVNGERRVGGIDDIDPATIESITVKKDDPQYPGGAIYITLK